MLFLRGGVARDELMKNNPCLLRILVWIQLQLSGVVCVDAAARVRLVFCAHARPPQKTPQKTSFLWRALRALGEPEQCGP